MNSKELNNDILKDFENIFNEINESVNDFDTLRIGTQIIKMSMQRLNGDLNNKEIKAEYERLNNIYHELNDIIKNYV